MTQRVPLRLLPLAFGALALAPAAAAGDNAFSGLYVGAEIGAQSVIAGADVGGADILAQDSKPVASAVAGFRHAWETGLMLGLEGSYGAGDLALDQQSGGIDLTYDTNHQWSYGAVAGWAPGGETARTLYFVYVSETKRDFDVTGTGPGGTFRQTDSQGLLRYGLGVERTVSGSWSVRASLGSSRAEFDDRPRNFDPVHPVDVSVGVIHRF
jgi:hypothetical protein